MPPSFKCTHVSAGWRLGLRSYEDVVDALIRCRVLRRVRVGVVPGEAKITRMGHLEGVEQLKLGPSNACTPALNSTSLDAGQALKSPQTIGGKSPEPVPTKSAS